MIRDLEQALKNLGPVAGVLIALALAGLALFPAFGNPYTVSLLLSMAMYVALTASWNILSGYAGYVSFGHVVFWGVGAYGTAILVTKLDVPWSLAFVGGGVVASLLAAMVAQPILKLSGVYFAISTLALAEAMRVFTSYFRGLTGGGGGIYMAPLISLNTAYYLMIGVAAICVAFTYTLNFTRFGRSLIAIRENELAAESLGIDTTWRKAQAFVISAFLAGLTGGAYVLNVAFIDPGTAYDISITLRAIMMAMFGGIGTVLGPVIGAVGFQSLSEALWANFPFIHKALLGALIIALVLLLPQGILPSVRRFLLRRTKRIAIENGSGADG